MYLPHAFPRAVDHLTHPRNGIEELLSTTLSQYQVDTITNALNILISNLSLAVTFSADIIENLDYLLNIYRYP